MTHPTLADNAEAAARRQSVHDESDVNATTEEEKAASLTDGEGDGEDGNENERDNENGDDLESLERAATMAKRILRDKKTRFEMDERRPAGLTALTDTINSDATYVPMLDDTNNQTEPGTMGSSKTDDLRYQMMERKLDRLERRLEAYEGLQYQRAKSKAVYVDSDSGAGADTQQLIEFFLTEMDKQTALIAQMRANQRVLEQKLEESMQKTHRFHREQLHRMSKFQEVVQIMNSEFVRGSMLREEEKTLEKTHHDKKQKAVRRALDEQITDLKNETTHQRRRLEIKFEKKYMDLATENQLIKAENLELRDELSKLGMAARSTKRTVRVLSEEVIKLKRAVGSAPNAEVEELLRVSGGTRDPHSHSHSHGHGQPQSPVVAGAYRDGTHHVGT